MKKHLETIFLTLRSVLLATVMTAIVFGPTSALAATNTATWDIGGISQLPNATFELISFDGGQIFLTKTAFTTAGVELTDGQSIAATTQVDFMIILNNENLSAVNNISIEDILTDGSFDYVAGNMRFVAGGTCATDDCSGAGERSTLLTAANGNPIPDETVELGDVAGYTANTPLANDETVSIGSTANNAPLNLAAGEVFALVFRATVQ